MVAAYCLLWCERLEVRAVKWFQPGISARRQVLGGSWSLKR